ncbi:hypothetical protein jhhlp_003418 [Lomentospora prolificans]|uniref:Anaphase-promoting complex subunit 4 WD40 domain-containing protein n=1 Tax=Lomentospora prolificans TaxID=41688 RepID=A0A2N3N8P6_9PEZI|nr:hypothetical protein jhhlp_003418 [Lomentospora prolificans]
MPPPLVAPDLPPAVDERTIFDLNLQHGHKDLVQAVAFNTYGDRCATGSVDAHGEILELQWLPATIYPNLIASLGIEGRFKLWAEDPSAPPGRRFVSPSRAKAAFDTRSSKGAPYRSFSMKHIDPTHHTYLALLDAHGRLSVYESDEPEQIDEYIAVDELSVCPRPPRGEEISFRVRFDPNPEVCYNAVRAGVATDSVALVVAAMSTVKLYRSRDVVATSAHGVQQAKKEFYLAAEMDVHRGLVRDVAWAPGNIRGYDMVATACQDGFVRVFRIDTPFSAADSKSWSVADLVPSSRHHGANTNGTSTPSAAHDASKPTVASGLSASFAKPNTATVDRPQVHAQAHAQTPPPAAQHQHQHQHQQQAERNQLAPNDVTHNVRELSRLDSHRTPVWRVGFDDDGLVLGSVGDDGHLVCYRQMPSGGWAKSSELSMLKARMVAP